MRRAINFAALLLVFACATSSLNVLDALAKIDPSLEEAAESVGSRGWRKFWTITLPLTTPGYVAGALLVFIWTFADFATPLVVGIDDLLASQAYLNIVQFVDRRLFKMGIVISAIMVLLAIVFLIIAKKYVAIKDYSSLSYTKIERKKLPVYGEVLAREYSDPSYVSLHRLTADTYAVQHPGEVAGEVRVPGVRVEYVDGADPRGHPQIHGQVAERGVRVGQVRVGRGDAAGVAHGRALALLLEDLVDVHAHPHAARTVERTHWVSAQCRRRKASRSADIGPWPVTTAYSSFQSGSV